MTSRPEPPPRSSNAPKTSVLATPASLIATAGADAWLAAIIDSSDDAIVSKSLEGIVTSWNPAAERMFGWRAEEMIGQSIRRIVPADRQSEEDEVLARLRRGEPIDHFETVRQRKDGSTLEISLTVSPIRDREGRIVGASKVARDITERKRAEAAIAESMAIKDQFLSLVSHELRTPLSIILGNGQLLTRRGASLSEEERARSLHDITTEAEQLLRIVENLLLLTRAEAEKEFELEVIHIGRLTTEAVTSFQRRHPDRSVQLTISENIHPTVGESTITRMVLENLLNNAAKYSEPGTPIEVEVLSAEGGAEVRVLDRGIGLTDQDLEGIFNPFFRAQTAKEAAAGMGLGLAVCRRVVEAQGGSVYAAQRPTGGSVFGFTLKAVPMDEDV